MLPVLCVQILYFISPFYRALCHACLIYSIISTDNWYFLSAILKDAKNYWYFLKKWLKILLIWKKRGCLLITLMASQWALENVNLRTFLCSKWHFQHQYFENHHFKNSILLQLIFSNRQFLTQFLNWNLEETTQSFGNLKLLTHLFSNFSEKFNILAKCQFSGHFTEKKVLKIFKSRLNILARSVCLHPQKGKNLAKFQVEKVPGHSTQIDSLYAQTIFMFWQKIHFS